MVTTRDRADKASIQTLKYFHVKDSNGIITDRTRSIIRLIVSFGVPQKSVFTVLHGILTSHGITVIGSFDTHSVRRIVLEGGVLATCQLGQELHDTPTATVAGDGTTYKNVNLESAFVTLKTSITSEQDAQANRQSHQTRALPLLAATSHTSAAQLAGWDTRIQNIIAIWNACPISDGQPLSLADILGKLKGMLSDHANDQKSLCAMFAEWKRRVDREERGKAALELMSGAEIIDAYMPFVSEAIAEAGGYDAWENMPEAEKKASLAEIYKQTVHALGEERFQQLPDEVKWFVDLFLWGGCGMHKAMNAEVREVLLILL
ncbi:hypothetical protein BXZ70DRAFT_902233 [Cristinia sonorae]|uniref:Uncharacterized protein n=1 Tax=Cristinia sonorae TaxID=1940300 RepID=A0A8K0UDM4_9AGAR|nr:hypothetical protein BXZ70DRAFT_902233 [Cristinia sonorae]